MLSFATSNPMYSSTFRPMAYHCKLLSRHQPLLAWRARRVISHDSLQTISNNLIEVETRFAVTTYVRQTLLNKIGPPKQITIHDCYLSQDLALMDRWLRKRNDTWQLKVPVSPSQNERSSESVVIYKELEGQPALLEVERLGFDVRHLDEYANLVTVRNTWGFDVQFSCGLYNVLITLDDTTASDGFCCSTGEVETLIDEKDDMEDASNAVEHVCGMYGLNMLPKLGGSKIIKYLFEKNRLLHDKLEKVGLT